MIKIKTLFLISFMLAWFPFFVSAQSNTVIDNLLEQDKADWGQTAYLVLSAADLISENTSISDAMIKIDEQQWNKSSKKKDDIITRGEYSLLLMKAFNMKGGIMYTFFQNPRYAARELEYKNLFDAVTSPYSKISGEEVLRIMGRFLELKKVKL